MPVAPYPGPLKAGLLSTHWALPSLLTSLHLPSRWMTLECLLTLSPPTATMLASQKQLVQNLT